MPRNIIGKAPFRVRTIESDQALTLAQITSGLKKAPGISLCVRTVDGHEKRGGYFFHIENASASYRIFDFEKNEIATLTPAELVRFVNHVSGRQFDAGMLVFCQSVVNFRQDQIENDQEA